MHRSLAQSGCSAISRQSSCSQRSRMSWWSCNISAAAWSQHSHADRCLAAASCGSPGPTPPNQLLAFRARLPGRTRTGAAHHVLFGLCLSDKHIRLGTIGNRSADAEQSRVVEKVNDLAVGLDVAEDPHPGQPTSAAETRSRSTCGTSIPFSVIASSTNVPVHQLVQSVERLQQTGH